jgi:NADH-quinone oxidoreductase subunit C
VGLSPQEILAAASEKVPGLAVEDPAKPWIVPVERLLALLETLRDDPRLAFNSLMNLTAVDRPAENHFEIVYHLNSMTHHHSLALKVLCDRANPHMPTATRLWSGADWFEREVFDLFGVIFDGHPDLRRILCPDDWEGHPLRKDYVKTPADLRVKNPVPSAPLPPSRGKGPGDGGSA